jgi:hypothetical protein
MPPQQRRIRIFYSYAAPDEPLLGTLREHLTILEREFVDSWHRGAVLAGKDFLEETRKELACSDIALLLLSSSFLSSKDLFEEMEHCLDRQSRGEIRVLPILLRPTTIPDVLSKLALLPENGRAITSWPRQDEAWLTVDQGIRAVIDDLRKDLGSEPYCSKRQTEQHEKDLLQFLYEQREAIAVQGGDLTALDAQILSIRRNIRRGPQLNEGEFLEIRALSTRSHGRKR